MSIFKIIKVSHESDYSDSIVRGTLEFMIPGINSGVYTPTTLAIVTRIQEWRGTIFGRIKKHSCGSSITLSKDEFDDLYDQMTKIKELRDNKVLNKKI